MNKILDKILEIFITIMFGLLCYEEIFDRQNLINFISNAFSSNHSQGVFINNIVIILIILFIIIAIAIIILDIISHILKKKLDKYEES